MVRHVILWKLKEMPAAEQETVKADIKAGLEPARRCEHCDYCKQTKVLTGPVSYLEGYDA